MNKLLRILYSSRSLFLGRFMSLLILEWTRVCVGDTMNSCERNRNGRAEFSEVSNGFHVSLGPSPVPELPSSRWSRRTLLW